jgi:N6-adenosine-specific RNA methylase IME4
MRTLKPGRTQVNLLPRRKREHSRKPDEFYSIIEECSPGPYLELFARHPRKEWVQWGNEEVEDLSAYPVKNRKSGQQLVFCEKKPPRYG